MSGPVIETPRGTITINANGKAELKFNSKFRNRWQSNYSAAQKFVDSEVLRLCEPYIPLLTSMLIKSGILGTDVGSGTVQWIAPYAKAQYYSPRKPGSSTGPLRGPQWFERMKSVSGKEIVAGARKIAGRE
ncbi:MAG: capsid protein [Chloroflexi bacterium]|nr:MAG: capsid protein [Chloroflexota bacterium]